MTNRRYTGDAVDASWTGDLNNRPFGNGETIDVIDDSPQNGRQTVELPADFYLGPKGIDVFYSMDGAGWLTLSEISDRSGIAVETVRSVTPRLVEHDLAEIDAYAGENGAHKYRLTVSESDHFVFSNGVSSDLLPARGSDRHPLNLTQRQRTVLAHASRYPTKSLDRIAESLDMESGNVYQILTKFGDTRRKVETQSVVWVERELNLINERIEHLEERREVLNRMRQAGKGFTDEYGETD